MDKTPSFHPEKPSSLASSDGSMDELRAVQIPRHDSCKKCSGSFLSHRYIEKMLDELVAK